MTASRSFAVAAKSKAAEKHKEYPEITYDFEEEPEPNAPEGTEPKIRYITTKYPGAGALTQVIATSGVDGTAGDQLNAMYQFLEQSMPKADYLYLRKLQREDRLDEAALMAMVRDMVKEWSTFPTQPQSASPSGRPATGTRSTGKLQPGE